MNGNFVASLLGFLLCALLVSAGVVRVDFGPNAALARPPSWPEDTAFPLVLGDKGKLSLHGDFSVHQNTPTSGDVEIQTANGTLRLNTAGDEAIHIGPEYTGASVAPAGSPGLLFTDPGAAATNNAIAFRMDADDRQQIRADSVSTTFDSYLQLSPAGENAWVTWGVLAFYDQGLFDRLLRLGNVNGQIEIGGASNHFVVLTLDLDHGTDSGTALCVGADGSRLCACGTCDDTP